MALMSMLFGSAQSGTKTHEITYALFRFYCGISIAIGAGFSKVFHKINEEGGDERSNLAFGVPDWFVEQVGEIGFTFISPSFWAHLAVYGEFIGGLLVAFGFLTRISALQLAFQFFVVSFIWYQEPELFGMYYQQLIFWAFVLIAALGGGQFSLDNWLKNRRLKTVSVKNSLLAACLLCLPFMGFSQTTNGVQRVSFTLSNPSLKARSIDIRHYDPVKKQSSGYGYDLGGLSSHAVNMPAGTRIYRKNHGDWQLAIIITSSDNGCKFDLTQTYEISQDQWQQAIRDEQDERIADLEAAGEHNDLEALAKEMRLEMVTFVVAGKSLFGRQVHMRAQLPFDDQKSNMGFSRKINFFSRFKVSYPVGTKVYLCDGAYWKGGEVHETLLFEVDTERKNYLVRL